MFFKVKLTRDKWEPGWGRKIGGRLVERVSHQKYGFSSVEYSQCTFALIQTEDNNRWCGLVIGSQLKFQSFIYVYVASAIV